jgi:hypothetical protein
MDSNFAALKMTTASILRKNESLTYRRRIRSPRRSVA